MIFNEFAKITSERPVPSITVTLENSYTMPGGFIGRQIGDNEPQNLAFTWRHYFSGTSWISVPLSTGPLLYDTGWLRGYTQEEAVIALAIEGKHQYSQSIDLNQIVFVLIAVISLQNRLMEAGGLQGPLYSKCVLHNVWRKIPLLDTESYVQFVATHGFPIIQYQKGFAPPGTNFESLQFLGEKLPVSAEPLELQRAIVNQAGPLMIDIFNALGLPPEIVLANSDWLAAAERAANVIRMRLERCAANQ